MGWWTFKSSAVFFFFGILLRLALRACLVTEGKLLLFTPSPIQFLFDLRSWTKAAETLPEKDLFR